MIKVKDGYAKLIGTTYQGSATQVLLSNGGNLEYSASSKASTLVQRNASQHIYATYFNSAISDEALTNIGSVYVRNTSDTFIRRVSKTQFYSILDNKFVTLDTTQSITGAKTFSTSVRFVSNASIIQNQNDTSNYTTILKWYKNGASRNTYDPSIGQHNTGGDGNGSICILPYPTATSPWGGTVGLFISKGVLKLDGKSVALAENYYTKTESDKRYVNVTGDTMTGPLIVKAAITGTQLISTIATGTSPLKVTSTTVVTNLNSDLLDGLHETSFFRARGDQSIASSVPTTTELANNNNLCGSWNVKYTGASGHLVQFNTGSGSTRYMQFYSMYSGSLYWRNSTNSTLNTKSWKTIVDSANYTRIVLKIGTATKGSATLPIYLNAGTPTACSTTLGVSITGNAATATKLQTARTINGTSFNGTTNIVTAYWGTARTISLSGAVTGSASVNGSQNVTITTTYQFGSIDRRYVTLATNQTVSGIKTFSTQQKFTVATGTSPFTVSSTTVVSNLNADMLDGWHLNYILKDGYVTSGTAGLSSYWRKVWDITLNNQSNDVDINLLVHSAYNQQWGIISFRLRQNGTGTAKNIRAYLAEVVGNIPTDRFRLYYNNSSGLCQLWCNPSTQYSVYNYRVLAKTWRTGTEATTLGTFYTGNTTTAQSLPSDSYVSMTGITIVNTAAKVANTLTFSAGKFSSKTYNGSSAITVNVPTHTSHLTNNSGFWTGTRYWANIAVSTSSSISTSPTFRTAYTSNWFRSTGSTGWYSQTYGGGWYMSDSTWIRTFGSKSVYQNTGQIRTDGYLVTNGGITVGATSPKNGTYKSHVTGNSWSSGYIRAGAGFYHNSVNSNSYVLLAGGSYKSLAAFAKGNAGASNRGVYVTNGTVTAMTYYLNATVNSGASGKLAYYRGTNSIDDYTNTIGSSSTPIYINNGIPNAANSYKVVNRGHYFSAFGISGYIYVIRYGQVVCVSINMYSGGNGSTGTTTLLTNLPSAVYTTGQSASKGGGSALRQATFYVSGTTLQVYSYQANQLPNKVSFTYITNTRE